MRRPTQRLLFAAALLTGLSAASAKPASYNFADIGWNLSKTVVKSKMAAKGYTYFETDEDGDLWFKGTVSQEKAQIVASFTPANKLVQMQVIMAPKENFFIQRFKIVKESLTQKYGTPDKNEFSFASPYKSGDGYETQAIRQGKATLRAKWMTPWVTAADGKSKESFEGLSLQVSKDLRIYITYSHPSWNAEYKRRYERGNNDL